MPLYDYQCTQCKAITEVRHGFDDTHTEPCPSCGGKLNRLFNPASIVFKGSGFYITDSRKPESSSTESAPASSPPAPSTPAPSAPSKESAA